MLIYLLFLHVCLVCGVYALPSVISLPTPSSQHPVVPSRPTPAPAWPPDLVRRDVLPLNTCGWLSGKSDDPFYCVDPSATCLWNNRHKFVDCMTATTADFMTSCKEYDAATASNCDAACSSSQSADPGVWYCDKILPYCNTVYFPDSFSLVRCGGSKGKSTVELSIKGQTTAVDLPRFLVDGALITSLPFTMAATSSSASSTPTYIDPDGGKVSKASIVAACVGGGVLLLGLPFGVKMYMRKRKWKKSQRPRRLQEREMRRQWAETGNPYAGQTIPVDPVEGGGNFLFSQDWPVGQSTVGGSGGTKDQDPQPEATR